MIIYQQPENNSVLRTILHFGPTALLNQASYCLCYVTNGSMDKESWRRLPDVGEKEIAGEEG